jgi:hypothetical protein
LNVGQSMCEPHDGHARRKNYLDVGAFGHEVFQRVGEHLNVVSLLLSRACPSMLTLNQRDVTARELTLR